MDIKILLKMFHDEMTLEDISKNISCTILDIVTFGKAWGYDFDELSRRNQIIHLDKVNKIIEKMRIESMQFKHFSLMTKKEKNHYLWYFAEMNYFIMSPGVVRYRKSALVHLNHYKKLQVLKIEKVTS